VKWSTEGILAIATGMDMSMLITLVTMMNITAVITTMNMEARFMTIDRRVAGVRERNYFGIEK
jgi:hypothetical protein